MIRLSVSVRRGLAVAGLAAVTVTAAGCGSSGGTTASQSSAPSSAATSGPASPGTTPGASTPAAGPSSGPSSRSSAGSGLAACSTSALSVGLGSNQGGGAAGSTYLPINFTNTSGAGCALYGYPGVSFVTGPGGTQIGAAATRASGASSVSVTLAAHATAHAWLQVVEASNYPASTCQPVTAHWLKVYPPGNTAASYIGHSFPACSSGKVTVLTVMPVRSGAGVQGQVP
jgi:Protein of unknown function (DUF4232)